MPNKVFQIGFNKCGTRTLHRFLELNGFQAAHWDHGHLARNIYRNLTNGESLIKGYERFEVFSDMEHITRGFAFEAYKLFPLLADEFPNALFVLNTRDREDWIRSRFDHREGAYARRWKAFLGVDDDASLAVHWRAEWDRHHERVRTFFAGRNLRFLQFDLASDTPAMIARHFPDRAFDLAAYRVRGRTKAADRQAHSARAKAPAASRAENIADV